MDVYVSPGLQKAASAVKNIFTGAGTFKTPSNIVSPTQNKAIGPVMNLNAMGTPTSVANKPVAPAAAKPTVKPTAPGVIRPQINTAQKSAASGVAAQPKPMNFTSAQLTGLQAAYNRGETAATNKNIQYAMARGWKPTAKPATSNTPTSTITQPTPTPTPTITQPTQVAGASTTTPVNPLGDTDAQIAALNKQISSLNASERAGITETGQQTIPMEFITGQQQAIEQRALGQRQTLQDQLANLQAERAAKVEQANFENALTTGGYKPYTGKVDLSGVTLKTGLTGNAISSIKNLANKPVEQWSELDKKNFKYATGKDVSELMPQQSQIQTVFNPYTGQRTQMVAPLSQGLKEISAGASLYDPRTGKIIGTAPSATETITPYQQAQLKLQAAQLAQGQTITPYQQAQLEIERAKAGLSTTGVDANKLQQATKAIDLINELKSSGGLGYVVGKSSLLPILPGTEAANAATRIESLKALLTLDNMKLMKGVLSDSDMKIISAASSALNRKMTEQAFTAELNKIENTFNAAIQKSLSGGQQQSNPINTAADAANVSW